MESAMAAEYPHRQNRPSRGNQTATAYSGGTAPIAAAFGVRYGFEEVVDHFRHSMGIKALRPMARMLARFAAARFWVALFLIACSGNAWAERRIALVVGNSSYKVANLSLANPKNDAQDVSAALNGLGFEVVTVLDASKRDMDLAMQRFARLAIGADSAVFFYAGHAVQYRGRNFLMPVDAELEDEISVQYQTVAVDDVRGALDRMNGVKIIFLDACRNNPLADRLNKSLAGASRAVAPTRGLARPDKVEGTVVAYATAADDVAQDGQGRNSPFTAALLKRLQEAGLEIELMLRRVSRDVAEQTGGKQRPETYVSLQSEYYLNQNDRIAWEQLRGRDDAAALRGFISKYPS
jgi:Caspase domain